MPVQSKHNDHILFKELAEGSEKELIPIHKLFYPQLLKYCSEIITDQAMAKAATLEVMIKLWTNRKAVSGMDNPVGWLFKCAERECLNWLRSERRKRIFPLDEQYHIEGSESMEGSLEAKELSQLIHLAIEKLPDQQKKVMQLKIQHGMNRREIAAQCRVSESTVKNQITEGYKNLRTIMDSIYKEYLP